MLGNRVRGSLLLLLPLLGTCAHRPWEDPGPRWTRVTSQHFIVDTDSAPQDYQPIIDRLEDVYSALSKTFFRGLVIHQVHVLLFDRHRDFKTIAPKDAAGFFAHVGKGGVLVFSADMEDFDQIAGVAAHELAHRFVHGLNRRVPAWLHEGFAKYVGAIELRDQMVAFDARPIGPGYVYFWSPVPFTQLLAARHTDYHGGAGTAYYMTSWMLVRHLLARPGRDTIARFQTLLQTIDASSPPKQQAAALGTALGGESLAEVEKRVGDWHFKTRWGIAPPEKRDLLGARVERATRLAARSAPLDPGEVRALCLALMRRGPAPPLPQPRHLQCYAGHLEPEGPPEAGAPAPDASVPAPAAAAPITTGAMDKQAIQRVVHGQADSLKDCFEAALPSRPQLAGRIVVQFTIAPDGSVSRTAIASSTAAAPEVEACMGQTICHWTFPRPEGGVPVIVKYPFTLRQRPAP